jgi:putative membrane protein
MFQQARAKCAATLAFAALGLAIDASAQAPTPKPSLAHRDVKFLQEAAAGNMAEVELGRLAAQKAMRDEVKQFGTRMVDDHTKANDDLKAVASANGVTLPAATDKKVQKEMSRLEKLSGGDFERAYMKAMVKDHRKDVHEFREHAKSKRDNDARAFAARTLPILISHLDAAIATNDIVQAPKRTGKRETGSTKP